MTSAKFHGAFVLPFGEFDFGRGKRVKNVRNITSLGNENVVENGHCFPSENCFLKVRVEMQAGQEQTRLKGRSKSRQICYSTTSSGVCLCGAMKAEVASLFSL